MKRGIIFVLLILSINLALAAPNLAFNKQDISLGETIFGTLSGNFEDQIQDSSLLFYQGVKQVFFESGITAYNGTYYLYISPTKEGNFTLKINNILYRDPELKSVNLERSFTVTKRNQSLSITPGVLVTSSGKDITFANRGSTDLNVSYEFEGNKSDFPLAAGSFMQIPFYPRNDFSFLKVTSYETFNVPIILLRLTNNTNSSNYQPIGSVPSFLKVQLNENQSQTKQIILVNPNKVDVQAFLSKNSSLYNATPVIVPAEGTQAINLTFLAPSQGVFNDSLKITFNPAVNTLDIPIDIFVYSTNYTIPSLNNTSTAPTGRVYCSSLLGKICSSGQYCNGTSSQAIDGYCCIGNCYSPVSVTPPQETSGSGWLIGIIIVAILGVGGYFVYKKYQKTTPKTPTQTIKEKSDIYEKRISGGLTRE